jgi:DNA-binding CsgD family transcriptional regulator
MIGASVRKQIGKPMHQVFPREAPKLKPAFQRVLGTGNSLSNVELKAKASPEKETHHWLVNFYPVKDELGQVRLVATVFSEVTKRHCVESLLRRIGDMRRTDVPGEPALPGEEFAELSERTLELVTRSVALLKTSISLRSQVSEMRLETGLERLALFLTVSPDREPVLHPVPAPAESEPGVPSLESSPNESEQPSGGPSLRERQVLLHLADGKSNKEIGAVLDLSTRTVENYRARIMVKLDLHSTAALVRYAIRQNIVEA